MGDAGVEDDLDLVAHAVGEGEEGGADVAEDLLVLRGLDDVGEDRDRRPQHVEGRGGLGAADVCELSRRGPQLHKSGATRIRAIDRSDAVGWLRSLIIS